MKPKRRHRHKKSEDLLYDIDLKMTKEAFKLAKKRKPYYIS